MARGGGPGAVGTGTDASLRGLARAAAPDGNPWHIVLSPAGFEVNTCFEQSLLVSGAKRVAAVERFVSFVCSCGRRGISQE